MAGNETNLRDDTAFSFSLSLSFSVCRVSCLSVFLVHPLRHLRQQLVFPCFDYGQVPRRFLVLPHRGAFSTASAFAAAFYVLVPYHKGGKILRISWIIKRMSQLVKKQSPAQPSFSVLYSPDWRATVAAFPSPCWLALVDTLWFSFFSTPRRTSLGELLAFSLTCNDRPVFRYIQRVQSVGYTYTYT